MNRISIRRAAQVGIANFSNQIFERSAQKAAEFLAEIDAALDKIEAQPRAYAVRGRNLRRTNLASYPYALFYAVETKVDAERGENFDQIVVLLCLHQSQDLDAASQL